MLTGGVDEDWVYLSSSVLYPGGCSVPSMESSRDAHVTFLTQESPPRITICGGYSGGSTKDCLVLRNGGWIGEELDDMPDKRYQSASARLDAGVFILGGSNAHTSSLLLRANSNSWVEGPQLPVAMRDGPCAAPISAHSFLIVYETHVYEFDTRVGGPTSSSGWKDKTTWPQLQVSRILGPGCAVVGNKFIVAGGRDAVKFGESLKSTEIIDLRTRSITAGGGMEKPREFFHLLSISGTLYALGGEYYDEEDDHYLADVEEFVEETGSWRPAESLPGERTQFGAVAVNKDLVCGSESEYN